jgi:hypothetical protein
MAKAAGTSTPRSSAARKAPAKRVSGARAAAKTKAKAKPKKAVPAPAAEERAATRRTPAAHTPSERDRRFNLILQTACLKAGSAAAISAITAKVPLLGRLAPALIGTVTETLALARIHQQLVRDILDLYDLELTELEERGVILLATAGSMGAQQISKSMTEQLVKQLGGRYLRLLATRALPIASLLSEIAAAIASTYAVGKRAQALCSLPGTGARNLGELLRGLSGIDQSRLFNWSGEALKLGLAPFRSILSLLPGAR